MATISENLKTIKDSTDAIKQAIIDKGGTIEGDITTWASAISGISGGGSSSGSEWVYLDVSNCDKEDAIPIRVVASYGRYEGIPDNPTIFSSVAYMGVNPYMVALAINLDFPISSSNSEDNRIMSLKEQMAEGGFALTDLIPNSKIITKEEFYSTEV